MTKWGMLWLSWFSAQTLHTPSFIVHSTFLQDSKLTGMHAWIKQRKFSNLCEGYILPGPTNMEHNYAHIHTHAQTRTHMPTRTIPEMHYGSKKQDNPALRMAGVIPNFRQKKEGVRNKWNMLLFLIFNPARGIREPQRWQQVEGESRGSKAKAGRSSERLPDSYLQNFSSGMGDSRAHSFIPKWQSALEQPRLCGRG